jgi:hypothetical protein
MDFDVNDYLIEGQTATIVFKSGDMSGVECEIWKYNNAASAFYITPFTDSDGYVQPNTIVHPHIGDSYTLVNISMPQSYVDVAELSLQAATQSFLDENCVPMVVYTVDIDPKYAESQTLDLDVGDKVTVTDTDLGIDDLIRIDSIEFPLINPYQIKATIADFVPYTLQERIIKSAISNRKETIFVDRRQSELARRNTVNQKSLKDLLFDTDLYFDPTNIKPLSIETAYLAVGTKSRDFWLSNVTIKANYEGDVNAIYVSAGSLVHLQISITGLGYTWVIGTPLDQSSLTPATAYYLYAKCSKATLTGEWVLSSSQITVEQEAGYYHFLIGMLFAVADGYRDFDFTNGMTYINGNTITTGKVQSIDGLNYFDLTEGKFKVGDDDAYVDWNVSASGMLTIKGAALIDAVVSNLILSELATIQNLQVQHFNGIAVPVGDLDGTVVNTQANRIAVAQIITVTKTPSIVDMYLTINGNEYGPTAWDTNEATTIINFLAAYEVAIESTENVTISYSSGTSVTVTANLAGIGFTYSGSSITIDLTQANVTALKRIDTVTLDTGTSGTANILCDGVAKSVTFINSYAETASLFETDWAASYSPGGVVVAASGDSVIFTSASGGVDFTGATTITNVPNIYRGSIKIEGNQIYENAENNNDYGVIGVNIKGYDGGVSRYRHLIIGNGRGNNILLMGGTSVADYFILNAESIQMPNLPTSSPASGSLYRDVNGFVKVGI